MFNSTNILMGGWPGGLGNKAKQYAGGTDAATAPVLPQADFVMINGGVGHAKLPAGEQGDEITIGNALATAVTLWPRTGGKIAGATASVSLASNTITTYRCVGLNSWWQMAQVTASALPGSEEAEQEERERIAGGGDREIPVYVLGAPDVIDGQRQLHPAWPGQPGQPVVPLAPGSPLPAVQPDQRGLGYWQDKPELYPDPGTVPVGKPGDGGYSLGYVPEPGKPYPPGQVTDPGGTDVPAQGSQGVVGATGQPNDPQIGPGGF